MKKLLVLSLITLFSCKKTTELKTGIWRATIPTAGGELPFNMVIEKEGEGYSVVVLNGEERLKMDRAFIKGDSLHIPMEIFDAEIVAKIKDKFLTGYWKKMRSDFTFIRTDFNAEHGDDHRFVYINEIPKVSPVAKKYSVLFLSADKQDSTQSVGVFETIGSQVRGSFLTTTGDYRYLAGDIIGDSLKLSCFDGTHAYLFKAKIDGDKMSGGFWSAPKGYESWTAVKDDNARLPDVTKLTYLKEGYKTVDFSFPNTDNKKISLSDPTYKGKVTVIQILGSWCPNCMDESRFLAPWYKKNKGRGVEIIGLSYEKSTDTSFAFPKIKRMKERFGMDYEVLLAGTNNKDEASKTLPMLNRVIGFPTTIFIDKKGQVREIHTGFSGPGTGHYYDEFVSDFNRLIDKLLTEKP
jgi:thiol-disulfide isomerase/thioredoxin